MFHVKQSIRLPHVYGQEEGQKSALFHVKHPKTVDYSPGER